MVRRMTATRGGKVLRTAALTMNDKTIAGCALFAEHGLRSSSRNAVRVVFGNRGEHLGKLLCWLPAAFLVQLRIFSLL